MSENIYIYPLDGAPYNSYILPDYRSRGRNSDENRNKTIMINIICVAPKILSAPMGLASVRISMYSVGSSTLGSSLISRPDS